MAKRSIIRYLAARIYSFHVPVVRAGKRYASVVLRLFHGKADRYGTEGLVAAIEVHIPDIRSAVRDGVLWVDKRSGRATITLAKLGPAELRAIARKLEQAADAIEMAMVLGADAETLEEAWLEAKNGAGRGRARRGRRQDEDVLDVFGAADDGDSGDIETGEEDVFE